VILPEKLSFRPGELAGPMEDRLNQLGKTPSEYIRWLIASDLGVDAPDMPRGNPDAAAQAEMASKAAAAKKRKAKKKKRK
jgi:hypothetical protein